MSACEAKIDEKGVRGAERYGWAVHNMMSAALRAVSYGQNHNSMITLVWFSGCLIVPTV